MAYTPILPATGVAGYTYLNRTRSEQQALFRASPEMQRDLDTFSSNIADVQSADDLLDNYQLLKVALGAFGLDEDLGNRGFMKAVLESDLDSGQSFVNRLADKRYLEFARAFNFAGEGGAQLDELKTVDAVKAEVQALASADDLLANGNLLRAALDTYGLGDDQRNTHFLKLVLTSDPSDPTSFANTLSDPRYAELSQNFGFGARLSQQDSLFGFADRLAAVQDTLTSPAAVLDQPDLLRASAQFFGISDQGTDRAFWSKVLNSDTEDATSYANRQSDPGYAAISRMFGFGDADRIADAEALRAENGGTGALRFEVSSLITAFTSTAAGRTVPYTDTSDFFGDFGVLLSTLDLMDLPRSDRFVPYTGRVLQSDPDDPNALVNLEPDPRYAALQSALNFQPVETGHSYPDGFSDAIAQRYVDRQFEVQVGAQDESMRIALSFERDLEDVVSASSSVNSGWYSVMASGPLRAVFENVLGLPSGFGSLDVDQQLTIFKDRAETRYGTFDLAALNTAETREQIRNDYLLQSDVGLQATSASSASLVLALLAG